MKSSRLINILASFSLVLATNALAGHKHHHHKPRHVHQHDDYARVTAARPIYQTVAVKVPTDYCERETVAYTERARNGDSFKGTLVGGLLGAAIGHEVSNGSGHAAAATGLIGAAIGNDVAKGKRHTRYEDREICRTGYRTEYQRQLIGYDVSYRHQGRLYHTQTAHHPGDRIAVGAAVRPYRR